MSTFSQIFNHTSMFDCTLLKDHVFKTLLNKIEYFL